MVVSIDTVSNQQAKLNVPLAVSHRWPQFINVGYVLQGLCRYTCGRH